MEFNEKNMMNILNKATKPLGMTPAFVIIDEYTNEIKGSMGTCYIGDQGATSTATILKETNKANNNG